MKERLFIKDTDYRDADGVANSTLLLMEHSASDVQWLKNAPVDVIKHQAADFGSALHTAILEPKKFDDVVYVSSVSGRKTKTFAQEIITNPDKIVLTEDEVQQIRLMQASGMAHPAFNRCLSLGSHFESSIFVKDTERDLILKVRPDVDAVENAGYLANLKTTASLDDWRSDRNWINPLYKFNYGHDAAYCLYVASLFYGEEIKTYKWLVLQKSISLGRYPVGCFTITKQELIEFGFWDRMLINLDEYALRSKSGDWLEEEHFPMFGDSMIITSERSKSGDWLEEEYFPMFGDSMIITSEK